MPRLPNTPLPMPVIVSLVAALLLMFVGVGVVVKTWEGVTGAVRGNQKNDF